MSKKNFNLKITGIDLIESKLNANPDRETLGDKFVFDLQAQVKISEAKTSLFFFVSTQVKEVGKELILAELSMNLSFEVDEFNKYVKKVNDTKNFEVDRDLQIELRRISMPTLRGVIFYFLRGTYLHPAILPLISVNDEDNLDNLIIA